MDSERKKDESEDDHHGVDDHPVVQNVRQRTQQVSAAGVHRLHLDHQSLCLLLLDGDFQRREVSHALEQELRVEREHVLVGVRVFCGDFNAVGELPAF